MRTLNQLVQPLSGLISTVVPIPTPMGEPKFPIRTGSLGDVSKVFGYANNMMMDGSGGDIQEEIATIKAIAETTERYSSIVYSEQKQFIWASANELGKEAINLDNIPKCSQDELSHPNCMIQLPKKDEPIRWVRGVNLKDKSLVWIPAVMVYLQIPFKSNSEKFWMPISTGCAAHTSMEQALINGICEVVERDAISLTWLQKLELPKLNLDIAPDWVIPFINQMEKEPNVKHHVFNATTDLGIPTLYSVQVTEHNPNLAALVMCSTELNPYDAYVKLMRESASSRIAMQMGYVPPQDIDKFISVYDGAAYMGQHSRLHAFDFLLNSEKEQNISNIENIDTGNVHENLKKLIKKLSDKGHEVYAVDLTTDEAKRAGLYVVRIVIPTLMPLSFSYRSRYLGTPRLFKAPHLMGYPVLEEENLNSWPQPFA